MARSLPYVKDGALFPLEGPSTPIVLDSPTWYAWLEQHASFAFVDGAGTLTVRKERGGYWKGYRRGGGKLRTAYLGRSAGLTFARLRAAAQSLAGAGAVAPVAARPAPAPAEPAGQTSAGTLLRTKFVVPPVRPRRVVRSSVLAHLCTEPLAPVVLVAAPPGYGKTTVIADWVTSDARAAAWLTLDAGDNDPVRFWTAIAFAFDTLQPGVVARALDLLRTPSPPPITTILAAVLNDLTIQLTPDPAGRPVLLVLDDYHVIEQRTIHETMMTLVERLPPQLRLVIASRADPPLHLGRLRVRGQLLEIRAADLAFSERETAAFLVETMGLHLSDTAIALLTARTEGWAAALQLAALSLRSQPDPAEFIATFGGSHKQLMGYLVDEVFDRQPSPIQTFLLATSVLDRMCAGLCEAVLEAPGVPRAARGAPPAASPTPQTAQDMLEALEAANLFVISLDTVGHWYRYHQLFAETVRQRLRRVDPTLEPKLRRHAAAWYEQAGYVHEAIEQALAGRDWEFAARLIEQFNEQLWRDGERATFERWLRALPPQLVAHRPRLGLLTARRYCTLFRFRAAEMLLNEIEQTLARQEAEAAAAQTLAPSAVAAIRAQVAVLQGHATLMYRGDLGEAAALARSALARLPPDDIDWLANATSVLAAVDYDRGELETARQRYAEAAALAQQTADRILFFYARHGQGVLIDMGRLREAQALCDEMYHQAIEWEIQDMPPSSYIDCLSALLRYEAGDLAEAERLATRAIELSHRGQLFFSHWHGCMILSWVHLAQGDTERALQVLANAESLVAPSISPDQPTPPAWWAIMASRANVLLVHHERTGGLAATEAGAELTSATIARWAALPATPDWPAQLPVARWVYRAAQLVPARARMLQGDHAGALAYLERLCAEADALGANGLLIPALALQALALEQLGRRSAALASLRRALMLAAPEGHARSIIDAGPAIVPLLRAMGQELPRDAGASAALRAYVRRLCDTASPHAASIAPRHDDTLAPDMPDGTFEIPLTSRELAVLRLLAAGCSNQQIADQLIIAVSTVKWYLRLIYSKLDATNRTQAVARARAHGIIH